MDCAWGWPSIGNRPLAVWVARGLVAVVIATSAQRAAFAVDVGVDFQQFIDGLVAYSQHETSKALKFLLPVAEKGDPLSQMLVGKMYLREGRTTNDCGEALKWFSRAAERGNADAQFELGTFYKQGKCVARNKRAALIWLQRSAQQGDSRAPNSIGEIYLGGGGLDYPLAVAWFIRGATLCDADAFYNLGVLSTWGRGVPKDYVEAYKWFELSEQFFGPGGDQNRAIRSRDALREQMMPVQVAEGARRADSWLNKIIQRSTTKNND